MGVVPSFAVELYLQRIGWCLMNVLFVCLLLLLLLLLYIKLIINPIVESLVALPGYGDRYISTGSAKSSTFQSNQCMSVYTATQPQELPRVRSTVSPTSVCQCIQLHMQPQGLKDQHCPAQHTSGCDSSMFIHCHAMENIDSFYQASAKCIFIFFCCLCPARTFQND